MVPGSVFVGDHGGEEVDHVGDAAFYSDLPEIERVTAVVQVARFRDQGDVIGGGQAACSTVMLTRFPSLSKSTNMLSEISRVSSTG